MTAPLVPNGHVDPAALSAHVDGELEPADAARVAEHLASCVACRGELARLAEARRAAEGLRHPVPPPDAASARFEEWLARSPVPRRLFRPVLRALRWPLAIAGLLLVAGGAAAGALALYLGNALFFTAPAVREMHAAFDPRDTSEAAFARREQGLLELIRARRIPVHAIPELSPDSVAALRLRMTALRERVREGGVRGEAASLELRALAAERIVRLQAVLLAELLESAGPPVVPFDPLPPSAPIAPPQPTTPPQRR